MYFWNNCVHKEINDPEHCFLIILVCLSTEMTTNCQLSWLDLFRSSCRVVIKSWGPRISPGYYECGPWLLSGGFIKVLNRRATELDTRAKNWQGPRGLAPWGGPGACPHRKNLKFYNLRDVFLHFEAADNDFQQPKKDNFSKQFNHDLILIPTTVLTWMHQKLIHWRKP